nr:hypothetical protein [Tanacetum cinerariifolium]
MTMNKSYLTDLQEIDGRFVEFGGNSKGGKVTRKCKIRTGKLDFEDLYFVKELKFNLFSVSQMRDKKNSVLFTDIECVVLSPNFKLIDESRVLLNDESNLWHGSLGHINFKTMIKLVRGNLERGLPSKLFENNHTCVACQKGKQHKASYKTKPVSSICKPLQLLHMDLFGRVSIKRINKKTYCLVVTDDFSRFTWVFFLATKDETPEILKNVIGGIENQMDHKTHTKTLYGLLLGRKPALSFMRPFECPVPILNTLDHLGNQINGNVGTKANINTGQTGKKTVPGPKYVSLPFLTSDSQDSKSSENEVTDDARKKGTKVPRKENGI